ncbi:DUF6174 domain-containing protein [Shewanella surugensis]|uniref:DUF6174 domain-containing protein n=1 Tax=Shewanella surugensis TaxID=212020 RepID=A0ABT0LJ98_9GAMM|nr:DUF6174 domain-containing protein [Shewanella surugensis]MCL1127783.1 DUF6174 domain-containing protein [Shewanella surugensis]
MKKLCILGLGLLLQSYTASSEDFISDFNHEVYGAYSKWYDKQIINYKFVYNPNCRGCGTYSVKVTDNKIEEVLDLDTKEYIDFEYLEIKTIDMLFKEIMRGNNNYYIIDAEYDSNLGFPKKVFLDKTPYMADEEISYSVSDLIYINPTPSVATSVNY